MTKKRSVLFVCYGNICRSPIGEAVFDYLARQVGVRDKWIVDSAATSNEEIGNCIWNTAQTCLINHGIHYEHFSRQITQEDFHKFDLILGFDEDNMKTLEKMKPNDCKAELKLVNDFNRKNMHQPIEDPWYPDTLDAFDKVYQDCYECCLEILEQYQF